MRPILNNKRTQLLLGGALLFSVWLIGVTAVMAQVYGVHRRTAVVSGPNRTVVAHQTTVVRAGGLPHGYIAALPTGYRAVYVSGVRYYTVGGIYYRPTMYAGRTTYVRVHL